MTFIVVYDANVLVGYAQRDLLIRIAGTGLVQAKWTERILDEAMAAVQKSRPNIPSEKITRLRALMIEAIPDCLVTGHEALIEQLQLRDPDDRHVLAAAIKVGAQVIVTGTRTSRRQTWPRGISRRSTRTTSYWIRSTSTTGSCGAVSSRSRSHASSVRRRSRTCSASWNDPAWFSPRRLSGPRAGDD
jgi:predicted nucleic acid-binding protein